MLTLTLLPMTLDKVLSHLAQVTGLEQNSRSTLYMALGLEAKAVSSFSPQGSTYNLAGSEPGLESHVSQTPNSKALGNW